MIVYRAVSRLQHYVDLQSLSLTVVVMFLTTKDVQQSKDAFVLPVDDWCVTICAPLTL